MHDPVIAICFACDTRRPLILPPIIKSRVFCSAGARLHVRGVSDCSPDNLAPPSNGRRGFPACAGHVRWSTFNVLKWAVSRGWIARVFEAQPETGLIALSWFRWPPTRIHTHTPSDGHHHTESSTKDVLQQARIGHLSRRHDQPPQLYCSELGRP